MSVSGKKVFVAGATGMAGSAIVRCLLGYDSSITIRAACGSTEPFLADDRIEYVRGDLRSADDCTQMIAGCQYAVMAAARTSGAGILIARPWEQVNDNLLMNATLLQCLAESDVTRVVLVGSATLYQEFDGCISEDQLNLNSDPPEAYFGIGWVSRYIEKLCAFWHRQGKFDVAIVRAANIFGPYARFDARSSNFIPALIRKAVDRMNPFEVWGSPDVVRDVIYADDFARCVVMLLERDDIRFDLFNIGSGTKTAVSDVVSWALKAAGHDCARVVYNPAGPTTARSRVLDCTKARQVLGWEPLTGVKDGIGKTLEWWVENREWWPR